jgi:drug/metabolite transporter (DMT)-like permease
VFTAWQLLLGGIPVVIAVPFEEGSFSVLRLSTGPLLALVYNLVIAFIFSYWAWTRVVTVLPVAVSSLSTLLVPVVGVFSGMLVLGERPQWTDFAALALVVASVAAVLAPARRVIETGAAGGKAKWASCKSPDN